MMGDTNKQDTIIGENRSKDKDMSVAEPAEVADPPPLSSSSAVSSTSSSPEKTTRFEPRFTVKFTDAAKDGELVLYTIRTKQIKDDDSDYKFIQRQWEDLEWLEHCLTVDINVSGIIVPPLPPKPGANAASAETRSRKQLGSATKTLVGDEFYRDCRMLEKYLRLLINHPTFGKNPALEKFLMQKEPPTRARVKKGMFSKLSSAVENRKSSHPDCDEFFQKERTWVTEYSNIMKDCSNAFNQKVYAQKSLANAYGHLATASTLQSASQEGHDICLSKFLTKFSSGLEGAKHGLEVMSNNDERTLGFYLEFYAMTFEAEKDMLLRRTCLLVEYETANKTLDKAKPNKKEAAQQAKIAAEKAFDECSERATIEIKELRKQYQSACAQALRLYAESKVKTAHDTHTLLAKCRSELEQAL